MAPRKTDMEARAADVAGGIVIGLFDSQPAAARGIQALKAAGFAEQQIGVAVLDKRQQEELIENTGAQVAEGAAKGATGGGVLGGVVGLLAGVGALVIPGIGPIIAGGALASTLAGAGIGAAAGGLIGALAGIGVPEEDARHFERGFQQGGVLVTVESGTQELARQTLLMSGADLGPGRSEVSSAPMAEAVDPQFLDIDQVSETMRREETPIESQGEAPVSERGAAASASEVWRGNERRYRDDVDYVGPERRLATP